MNVKRASIYKRRKDLFILSELQTEVGVWVSGRPCVKLASSAAPDEIGRAVLEALARSGVIVPHPAGRWDAEANNPILEAAGIKRWNTFQKGALSVSVKLDADGLTVFPEVNRGRDGFGSLRDQELHLPTTAQALELGQAIVQALALSK